MVETPTVVFALLLSLTAVAFAAPSEPATDPGPPAIVLPHLAGPRAVLAAREIRRYLYVRTGLLAEIVNRRSDGRDAIVLQYAPAELKLESYRLNTEEEGGVRTLCISGGAEICMLYGAYRFIEHLGVRFELHGDIIPDERLTSWRVPMLNETHDALFPLRGIQPFHDFTEGPDWWNADDYKAYLTQLAKLRMNFIGLHCYPEGGVGPEPTVWIGLADDCDESGRVTFAYPSRYASTQGGAWGYEPTPTSQFAAGAGMLFPDDDYGPAVTQGHRPLPATPDACCTVFNNTATMLNDVFKYAHDLGIKTCIGTETPLIIPQAVQQRLRDQGLDPNDAETVRRLYRGMFERIRRSMPVDYYWLWTPEGWTWSGVSDEDVDRTIRDMQLAQQALDDLGNPIQLATCGWVLGPPNDRTLFDTILDYKVPVSCINREVGFSPVEIGFARVFMPRPRWAIPWLEDDPALIIPQLWVGRMRRDAADAHAYGCTGLFGIHWRTRIIGPNLDALAAAAWDQQAWNPEFGKPISLPQPVMTDAHMGGNVADYTGNEIVGTDEDRVYQSCRWDLRGYTLKVPNGTYSVTLKFCEIHYREPGKRVFGANIQADEAFRGLDVFDRVGANIPLDLTFDDIRVTNEVLDINFVKEVEFPFVAGIVIEGTDGSSYVRKINCGGPAFRDYEADLPAINSYPAMEQRPRDLQARDFYADWCLAQFGPEVADGMTELFTRLDGGPIQSGGARGANLPRPSNWISGPGGIVVNHSPWEQEKDRYAFVDQMEAIRPRVVGAGNRERFDYWLNSFRYLRAVGELGCLRGELDRLMQQIGQTSEAAERANSVQQAITIRVTLTRLWEQMMTYQLGVVSTPGEMGTIANLEQHVRRHTHFLDAHDQALAQWLGSPLPSDVTPSTEYIGEPRIVVPTQRGTVTEGESLTIRAIVLDADVARDVTLCWRPLGAGDFRSLPMDHISRGVFETLLPPADGLAIEYFIEARTQGGPELTWPHSVPEAYSTIVIAPQTAKTD